MTSDGQTIFNGANPAPTPVNNTPQPAPASQPVTTPVQAPTPQASTSAPVFNSSDIAKSKAATKTNYFVNLKKSTAFDRLSEKLDQRMTAMEIEAKKRAEAEALAKANKAEYENPDDRFVKKESGVYVPAFVKGRLTNGIAEPNSDVRPLEAQKPANIPVQNTIQSTTPTVSPVSESPKAESAPISTPPKTKKPVNEKLLYGTIAGITAVVAAAIIIWQLIPQDVVVKKVASVAAPVEEMTLLDEVTEKRLAILEIFKSDGAEAGIAEYNKYASNTTDSKTLSLIYAWESLDLYRLYRGEYLDIIKQCISKAEELNPTEGTATLLYLSEHEFGDEAIAMEYRALVMERQANAEEDLEAEE